MVEVSRRWMQIFGSTSEAEKRASELSTSAPCLESRASSINTHDLKIKQHNINDFTIIFKSTHSNNKHHGKLLTSFQE